MAFQNKGFGEMPSARLDSHRNSVQNGVVESFPAPTGTIFVNGFDFSIFRTILRPKKPWAKPTSPFKEAPWNSQNRQIWSKIEPERAPEMMPKHRKSLPNGRRQEPQRGRRRRRRLVVFHLVRISYVLASFPEPVLARFSTKVGDSENSLPQGACSPNRLGL